jgi:predicted membrane channel-forming protein YqfA (hemolysin III family)
VLLNALLVTAVFAWTLTWAPGALPAGGWAPFAVLWLATQVHAPCSVGYHLFMPMGKRVSNLWRRLDVCAIFVASALLTYAMSAFVLPPAAVAALTSAAAALAAFACLRTWGLRPDDSLADSKASHACFVACGVVLYVTPVVMVMAWEVAAGGVVAAATSPGVLCGAGIVTSLALSGIVYSCSWPECQWPGAFDLVGNSHQLMHVGIMVTQCFQWGFLLTYAADHMRH